jgi:hypothetical protein
MRLLRLTFVLCVVLVATASPAGAVQLVNPDGSVAQPYQHWADLSRVPTPDRTITIYSDTGICEQPFFGCAATDGSFIALAPDDWPAMRRTLMHELGHASHFGWPEWKWVRFDRIMATRDIEVVAEAFADCALMKHWQGSSVPMTTDGPRQFRRICHLIRIPNA